MRVDVPGAQLQVPLIERTTMDLITVIIGGLFALAGSSTTAALIAALITRRRERRRAERQVADLPYEAPEEFVVEAAYIRSIRVFRKDYRVRFWFRDTGDPGKLKLETELSYTVVNYGKEPVRITHRLEVVPIQYPERILSVAATGEDLRGQEYHEFFEEAASPKYLFERQLTVPANSKNPGNLVQGRIEKTVGMTGHDIIFFPQPILFAEVIVEEKPIDLEVKVHFGHRSHMDVKAVPSKEPTSWRLRKALLPWASVYVLWSKR